MRIHTDTLTVDDLHTAAKLAGCNVEAATRHGSTARDYALDFIMSGHGKARGQYGNLDYNAASWDDYGIALAELFRRDPRAIVGTPGRPTYDGATDFHRETAFRYEDLTAEQAHHAHKRDHDAWGDPRREYVTETGRHLLPCKGSKGKPCGAYI
jgi:hypothetical protein